MRLADFILDNLEPILRNWEDFARSLATPVMNLDAQGLRNHAEYILRCVAVDMRTEQTAQQQIDKSQGQKPTGSDRTAVQAHTLARLMAGFTLDQIVSEYRALRSSVLRLWLTDEFSGQDHQVADVIRFNEAVDQALVESIAAYGHAVETTRKTVLGVLGHDLRTPLGAVMIGADLLRQSEALSSRGEKLTTQISTSIRRANQMVNDLLDLARCNLGAGIPVHPQVTNLTAICQCAVEELALAHPDAQILFHGADSITGHYDPSRMAQVFSNLIGNAVRHGNSRRPITAMLQAQDDMVSFTVRNFGEPIPPNVLPYLFDPERRYTLYSTHKPAVSSGLGLGLFIAAQIVQGHGGIIKAESTPEQGTTFRVVMPARP